MAIGKDDREALEGIAIDDVWGIGRRLSVRLRRIGLLNAWQFARAPSPSIRAIGGVTLERTQRELTGISCLEMEEVAPPRKNTCCSRSFGKPVTELEELEEEVKLFHMRLQLSGTTPMTIIIMKIQISLHLVLIHLLF